MIKEKKQGEVLKDLKPKEQKKAIEGKPDYNQSINQQLQISLTILLEKIKSIMNELYGNVDQNKLYFENVGPTKDVKF